ncbi:MAG: DUF4835 family protein [Bacteroidia bacterium]|nr:DUF4835 family protein [Bacteroidia bacterium]
MKHLVALFISIACYLTSDISLLSAQELNCNVQILSPTIQGTTEKKIFETLQLAISEFMNNTRWTGDQFKQEERITCNLTITINDKLSSDEFKGSMQIQSSRPVFKTSYNSLVFNHNDVDFQFKYLEYQPLEFSKTSHLSNLTSVLAFYAYMIIGIDYDTFSPEGGTPYFQFAQTIVNNAQNVPEKGWKAFEGQKNRYWMVTNMLDGVFKPIRECNYKYHRLGLDIMQQDLTSGRSVAADALLLLKKVHNDKPLSFTMQVYFQGKADEIVNLFSQSFPDEKTKIMNLLNEIDPGNGIKWQKIMAN